MRVVHISTSDVGGAGRAASRLHKGLRKEGIDSKFICLHKQTDEDEIYQFRNRQRPSLLQRVFQKVGSHKTKETTLLKQLQKHSGNFELFSLPYTSFNLLNDSNVREADLINLHWIADFVDYPSFFEGIDKPVVWTLHDKNPTLGGFHLLLDKEKNSLMTSFEQTIEREKKTILSRFQPLTVVSPSLFLQEYSKGSAILGHFRHHLIPNSIDTTIFKPHNQQLARQVFGIPAEKKVVLFLDSKSYHKGADVVHECMRNYKYENVMFIALGNGTAVQNNLMCVEQIRDERLMSLLYSTADLFLLPSREDNLPNMMLESLSCGTPVVGFPTGGICDVIKDGFTGMVTKDLSSKALDQEIKTFLQNSENFARMQIRDYAVQEFDTAIQARRYIQLYSSILDKHHCT